MIYVDEIETVQVGFIKQLFVLPKSTAGYLLRLESGLIKLKFTVLKLIKSFNDERLPLPEIMFQKSTYSGRR